MTLLARSAVLEGLDAVARERGLDPRVLLRRFNIPARALTERDLRIPADRIAAVLEGTARAAGIDDLGLRMAALRHPSVLGPLRLLLREQATVGAALAMLSRFGWAQIEGLNLTLDDDGEIAILRLSLDPAFAGASRESSELTLASLTALLREFMGPGWQPEMVLFTHERPASLARHLACFGRVPFFGQDFAALVMTSAELQRPIEGADPGAAAMVEQMLGHVGPGPSASEADRVLTLIRELLQHGECRASILAHRLGIDRRTLHRRLALGGTTFTALLAQTRSELSSALADGPRRSKTEQAGLLGFSCLSAYSRWQRTQQNSKRADFLSGTGKLRQPR
jgi:AraC-like DNA-binding protein